MKKLKILSMLWVIMAVIGTSSITVQAGTIYTSPYVSFSPDGQAWTTNKGDRDVEWYAEDGSDDVKVNGKSTLSLLQKGEHYYAVRRSGTIPLSRWYVHESKVNCCHTAYPPDGQFHGIEFRMQPCYKVHFSAWRPICADCGCPVVNWNFYMSKEAAASLDYLELGQHIYYYYLCPFNQNLEQGVSMAYHNCRDISANRYRVVYDANAGGENYSGYMTPSFHMYNNATRYEGREVTPRTRLHLNGYGRIGWEFVGWNTAQDGTGMFYEDGAEILNLCAADYEQDNEAGTVYLYAMWRSSESVLEIDPGGGRYKWNEGITEIEGEYGSSITLNSDDVLEPDGCLVSFDTCGGDELSPIQSWRYFTEWRQSTPFHGRMQGNTYRYMGPDGSRDRLTAVYGYGTIVLPEPSRENYSFAGWYYDPEYRRKAGDADDEYTPTQDVTLYAQWAQLLLESEEDMWSYGSTGTVDLQWAQEDGYSKSYKIYQCAAGQNWRQIYLADDMQDTVAIREEFSYERKVQYFTVPYTGFYSIEAYGAQGRNEAEYTGGLGGMVKGSFWLEQGALLEIRVGGQDTYNGGGESMVYGRGGDYTSVSMNGELLVMAGGGGGAGESGNGGAGGLTTNLVEEGHIGETGGAGGGGGYLGGRAGEAEIHYHEAGVCNHVHEGNSSVQGGCYTQEIKCGEKLSHTLAETKKWYWGGMDENYCPNCGADASKGESCSGHTTDYYRHDCPIHGKQKKNTSSSKPSVCSTVVGYGLTCGRTEEYFCGYPYDGYIISAKPAYGGSSYVNDKLTRSYIQTPGVREGEGFLVIEAESIGFWMETTLQDVATPDRASPGKILLDTVTKTPVKENTVSVQWEIPQDFGTVYYHKAESYLMGRDEVLSVSNVTADTIVSGVSGYWFLVDNYPHTDISYENASFLSVQDETGAVEVALTYENQYLHVKTSDYAENCSETVHIPIGSLTAGSEGVKWPVATEMLVLEDTDYVYPAQETGTYYVKSDGRTPVMMYYGAYMQGTATESYQLNYAIIECVATDKKAVRSSVYVPAWNIEDGAREFTPEDLRFKVDGDSYLQNGNYILATKSEQCRKLDVKQEFVVSKEANGQRIRVIPVAGVDDAGTVVYSDYEQDKDNGLWIIGDGEAPVISGLDELENLPILDRRTQEICLRVTAADELSGVREFCIEIENLDNGAHSTYLPDGDGIIAIDICADEAVFSGDFVVNTYAVDNVGNEQTLSYGTTEFDLQVNVERILAPHTPVFKCGESGRLNISAWGYAERIEVEFPEEITACNQNLNHVYEYELKGAYKQEEQMVFMIPFNVPFGTDYTVTVRAYKGDKMLERHPAMTVIGVSGSILDELRTRLR